MSKNYGIQVPLYQGACSSTCARWSEWDIRFYEGIDAVPAARLEQFKSAENPYMQRDYLRVYEQYHSKVDLYYLEVLYQGEAVALLQLQALVLSKAAIEGFLPPPDSAVQRWIYQLFMKQRSEGVRMLLCGNPFVTGSYGMLKTDPDNIPDDFVQLLPNALLRLLRKTALITQDIQAIVFKDFNQVECQEWESGLNSAGFRSFQVDDNLCLDLDSNWLTMDDYTQAMKTKFRNKYKRSSKLSAPLHMKDLSADEIIKYQDVLEQLYQQVKTRAKFNLSDFNTDCYAALKRNYGKDFFIRLYFLEDQAVGFMSGMLAGKRLDAHFVGLDYNYNKDYAVYQRLLYDYVALAITHKMKVINFGRTAGEIKSTLGALPQELKLFVRHPQSLANRILSPFVNDIAPSPFPVRYPFKQIEPSI